jgi:PAS domain S-box-containing protein
VTAGSSDPARVSVVDGVTLESRFRDVLDALFAFVGFFSLDGILLDCNQAPLAAGGLQRADVLGKRFVDLAWFAHSADERARVSEAIARAARGEPSRFETSVLSARGGVLAIDAAFAPLRAVDGNIRYVIGTGVDVSVRRQAENELRRSRERLEEAQRLAHLGSWEWDIANNEVAWSDELYEIYGVDRRSHVPTYEAFLASVHPDDREHTANVLRLAMQNLSPFVYDHRILRPDGSVRMLHTRGQVVGGSAGRALRLVGTCWDITRRWDAMRAAEAARAEAENARGELERILERVSDGFVALDRAWHYRYVNGSGGRLLGREAASLIGKHIWTEFPEGLGQKFQLAYQQAIDEQRPIHVREHYPPWDRWFENRIYPSPDGLSIFFTDVTEQQKIQEELRASAAELRALATRLSEIREEERRVIARELHDQVGQALTALKLDLAGVRGELGGGLSAETERRLRAMDGLVDQTLETTRRISATLRPAILDDLGLPAAIRWQAAEFTQRTGVPCETRLPEDGLAIGPATSLALCRILQEALTHVARHAQASRVRIELRREDDSAVLVVADQGRGYASDEISAKRSLGLVGMRERALALGGETTVSGEPGRGTTVKARIPAGAQEPA